MPVRVWHVKIALAPGPILGSSRFESAFFQMGPERVDIGDAQDQPTPTPSGLTFFQIQDCGLGFASPQGREIRVFAAIDEFHAENIPIEVHRDLHIRYLESDRRNLFHSGDHTSRVYLRWVRWSASPILIMVDLGVQNGRLWVHSQMFWIARSSRSRAESQQELAFNFRLLVGRRAKKNAGFVPARITGHSVVDTRVTAFGLVVRIEQAFTHSPVAACQPSRST